LAEFGKPFANGLAIGWSYPENRRIGNCFGLRHRRHVCALSEFE
jgi:hypothetical protein